MSEQSDQLRAARGPSRSRRMIDIDQYAAGCAIPLSPVVRQALAGALDRGPGYRWYEWHLMVDIVPASPYNFEERRLLPVRMRCSCGCCLPAEDCASRRIGRAIESELRGMGFWTGWCRDSATFGRSLKHNHRAAARNNLRCRIEWACSRVEVRFYVDHNAENKYGPRYAMRPERSASYLDRKLLQLVAHRLEGLLQRSGFPDHSKIELRDPRFDPFDRIAFEQLTCGHWRPGHGLPVDGHRQRTADGLVLTEGATVGFFGPYGDGGTLRVGRAYRGLNTNWYIVAGGEVYVRAVHELFACPAGLPRRWHPTWSRRRSLEQLKNRCIETENFERAADARDALKRLEAEGKSTVPRTLAMEAA